MSSRSWNRVELIGNLTRDPELRFIPSGTAVTSFGIATNRVYVTEGERKEEVDFHKIVAWGKLAELCNQLLKKGARVFISGRLQYREWETQDGQKRRDAEIVMEDMILITPKSGSYEHEDVREEKVEEKNNKTEKSNANEKTEEKVEKVKEDISDQTPKEENEDVPAKPNENVSDEEVDLPF